MTGNDKLSIDESDSSVPSLPDTDSEPELPEDDEPTQSHSSSHNKVVQESNQVAPPPPPPPHPGPPPPPPPTDNPGSPPPTPSNHPGPPSGDSSNNRASLLDSIKSHGGVAKLKKPSEESLEKPCNPANTRNSLLDSIRSHGGVGNLKKPKDKKSLSDRAKDHAKKIKNKISGKKEKGIIYLSMCKS